MQRTLFIIAVMLCSISVRAQFSGPAADSGAVYLGDSAYVLLDLKGAYTGQTFGYYATPLGDFDRDGFNDYAISYNGGCNIYRGGNPPTRTPVIAGVYGLAQSAGDLNNDGWIDLSTSSGIKGTDTSTARIYWGSPTGFDTAVYTDLRGPSHGDFFGWQSHITDIDGDGRNELVVLAQRSHTIYIYKYADTGLVREPWFVWTASHDITHNGPFLRVRDVDNDSIPDLVYWDQSNSHFIAYLIYGRTLEIPDTNNLVHLDTFGLFRGDISSIEVRPMLKPVGNDILFRTNSNALIYAGTKRRSAVDFDSSFAQYVLNDPILVDPQLTFQIYGDVAVGDVNGGGGPSIVGEGSSYAGSSTYNIAVFLYSAGSALNSRFDGAIDLTETTADLPGTPVDIGDIDGDSLHEIAIPDINYENATGRVLIIRGSTAYPHKPVRTDVASDGPVLQWGAMANYPNPCTSETTIETSNMGVVGTRLRIFDMLGNEVFHCEQPERRSFNSIHVSTESWSPGIYCCELITTTGIRTHLISKVQ